MTESNSSSGPDALATQRLVGTCARTSQWTVIRAASSNSATAALASWPKTSSGSSSGVTRCISTSSMFIAQTSCAAMSASSYSGSGHEHPGGTTKATDVDQPCSRSATMPLTASGCAPNVSACGYAGTARAPGDSTSAS